MAVPPVTHDVWPSPATSERRLCAHVLGECGSLAGEPDRHRPNATGFLARALDVYTRRMPRMQVYLPDELYRAVKERQLPASELLQEAVRAELRRQELLGEADRYVEELASEVGQPSAQTAARANRLAAEIRGRQRSRKAV